MTTNPTPAQGEHVPLWSDEQIEAVWVEAFQIYISPYGQRKLAKAAMTKIRDDYEATLTSLRRQLADADAEMVKLKMWLNATNDLLNEEEANNAE